MQTNFGKAIILATLAMTLVVLSNGTAMAQDGKALYEAKLCNSCHGPEGKAPVMPMYPKLAGQNAAYLEQQVKDIRDKKRTNGQATTMQALVATVTDAENKAISAYLATVK